MSSTQLLIGLIIISQIIAMIMLIISYYVDRKTFAILKIRKVISIPHFRKIIHLFRASHNPYGKALYLLALIFVIFSYIGFLLLLIAIVRWIIGL